MCGRILQNVNNRTQSLCQILSMVTNEIVIKSTGSAQHFVGLQAVGARSPAFYGKFRISPRLMSARRKRHGSQKSRI